MNYTNQELEQLTLQWGKDRKITINGELATQFLKLTEENGEFYDSEGDIEKIKDAIGDQIVVLTMINGLIANKFSYEEVFIDVNNICLITAMMCSTKGKIAGFIARNKLDMLPDLINKYLKLLDLLANASGLTLNECWNYAYNEIKDRKGYLAENGCFIKEEDYTSAVTEDTLDYFKS